MSGFLSKKIDTLSAICCLLVVFIHAEVFQIKLPDETMDVFGTDLTTFLQLFISEGIGRIAVPMFFGISGYLFFINYENTKVDILKKYRKKFYGYIIPYLFWSISVLVFYTVIAKIPIANTYITTRDFNNLNINTILMCIFISPVNSPLWFLRDLIVYTLISPFTYIVLKNKYIGIISVMVGGVIYLLTKGQGIIHSEGFFFINLGAYIYLHKSEKCVSKNAVKRNMIVFISWIALLVIKSMFQCTQSSAQVLFSSGNPFIYGIIEKMIVIWGCYAVWTFYDNICESLEFMNKIRPYSFIIYVAHQPVIKILMKVLIVAFKKNANSLLAVYILSSILTVAFVIGVAKIIKRVTPKFYNIIIGRRI